MDSQNNRTSILVVGATGHLGSLITKHCLAQPKLLVNILVRDPQKNKELTEAVEKAGGKVWKGDVNHPETLDEPMKGVHTVVSTTSQMDAKAAYDGQVTVIDAAVRNGVKRFVPSYFAENMDNFTAEEMKQLGAIESPSLVLEYLKTQPLQIIYFWPGLFLDSFFDTINVNDFGYWGNPDHIYDLTTYEDTAKYVAVALSDENRTGRYHFSVNRVTIAQVAEIYNRVRGTKVVPKCWGTLEDLRNAYFEAKAKDPNAIPTILLSIYLVIFDDRSTFDNVHNREFPDVKTTSIEEYLEQNPQIQLPEPTN